MRNPAIFSKADTGQRLGRAGERDSERSFNSQQASGDLIASFLNNVVMNYFTRESGGHCGARRDEIAPESIAAITQPPVEFRVLPAPEICALESFEIPAWKRILDIAIISLTWPLWLPLMLLIMLAIKITSEGPIFYRQERIGYRGRRFMIFKFRTMKVNVDTRVHESHFESLIATDSPMTKLDSHGDPRLIKWGRFYRAAGLDELPQIFNVLRGEMSLVGARPCTVHEFERYQPWQRERVNGPPGLTGYWQVNGKNKTTFSEMIEMDIFYGKNMSLGLDLSIMLRTPPAIVQQVLESRGIALWWNRQTSARPRPS